MTQKILFEGWDDFSLEEQEAIHAWIKGLSDASLAKQKFLDIYCFRGGQNTETPTSNLLSTTGSDSSEDSYMIVSSALGEEKNIINIHDFIKRITSKLDFLTNACQQCLRDCGDDIECRRNCRKNECK